MWPRPRFASSTSPTPPSETSYPWGELDIGPLLYARKSGCKAVLRQLRLLGSGGEAIVNDMTSDKIPSNDEYFEQLLDEEESRSHKKLNQLARLTLIRNAKLQAEIVNKITKLFPDMPGQWIAAAQYILFSVISSYP